jgi:hypothetical protein
VVGVAHLPLDEARNLEPRSPPPGVNVDVLATGEMAPLLKQVTTSACLLFCPLIERVSQTDSDTTTTTPPNNNRSERLWGGWQWMAIGT